jgi:hypothetical protein
MYQLLKDFAGPAATLIASITAIVVTALFSKSQLRIADSQRNIALDKLKHDLFQKRYEIYEAAKALLEYVPFITDVRRSDAARIRSWYVKIDEARFYFPTEICVVLSDIKDRCELFFLHLAMRGSNIDDDKEWSRLADILAADQSMLRAIYHSLPETFASALAFK